MKATGRYGKTKKYATEKATEGHGKQGKMPRNSTERHGNILNACSLYFYQYNLCTL
jgi:hypothetical protein